MNVDRTWVTPLAAGAFLLSAVTGVLIFFHLDSGLNKAAHEWLSWVLLGGVVLHGAANIGGLKRHFTSRTGLGLMGAFALVLALSFIPVGGKKEPPFMASIKALAQTPISTLAVVAQRTPDEVQRILAANGFTASTPLQSVADLVGPDKGRQMRVLEKVLARP